MGLKQITPGYGSGGGAGSDPTDEQLEQIGGVANDAKTLAQSAKTESAAAGAKADAAKTAADGYAAQITTATQKADAAKTAADAASAAAAAASGKADGVAGTATDAKTKAEAAQSAAATAGTKADAAKTTADGLDARVTAAETKATTAKTAADAATAAANTASTKADAAKTAGDDAKAIASGYEARIDDLESTQGGYTQLIAESTATANEANTAAQAARATADDLADDVATATTKADAAKAAADAAAVAAAEAKVTAGQAVTKANTLGADVTANSTAITDLDNRVGVAETKADQATAAANQAGSKADDLAGDVQAATDSAELANDLISDLTLRVGNAEAEIDALQAGGGTGGGGPVAPFDVLPLSHWLSVWGDSRTEQNWNSARNALLCRGYAFWAELLSRRVRVHKKYNFGKSGDDISQLYARMTADTPNDQGVKPSEVPAGPAVLFIGTNSIMQDLPLATLLSQLAQCIAWLKSKGHRVFVVADYPRGLGSIMSVNEQKLMASYVDAIRQLAVTDKDIRVIDPWPYAADPSVSTCIPLTGMVNPDGLHPSPGFGFIIGKLLAEAFKEAGFRKIVFPAGGQSLYDSVLNPKGNLIKNPNFSVTQAAAATPTTITGVVPTDWSLTLGAGLSLVGSVVTVTMPDGTKRKAWRATITGTTASDFLGLQVRQGSLDVSRVAEGDILEGHFECLVNDTPVNLISPSCNVATNDTATSALGGATTSGTNKDLTIPADVATGFYGITRAPEYVHQNLTTGGVATTLAFECRPYFGPAGTVNVVIDFLSASLRKK
ncbi:GDSL-like lipase [Pseudomonas phage phiK7B1]|nr:GDSL-like lipase [Pseudomonas phage phiK7B1]